MIDKRKGNDMKKYKADLRKLRYVYAATPLLYCAFSLIFRNRILAAFAVLLLNILALLTPYGYYVACGKLWLDGKTIRQGTSRQNFTRSLDQTRAYAQPRMIWGVLYYAFALQPLKTCSNKELLKLVRQKKAILYSWAPQLAHDYPELFERKAEN